MTDKEPDTCWWSKLGECLDHILIFCPKRD
jgi:hypothetical protein